MIGFLRAYFVLDITIMIHYRLHSRVLYMCPCTCVYVSCLCWCVHASVSSMDCCVNEWRARDSRPCMWHCSVASSYATLHIQLTYKYNDVTNRTTLLPRVSIQRDATRRSKGVLFGAVSRLGYLWFPDCTAAVGLIYPKPSVIYSLEILLDLSA